MSWPADFYEFAYFPQRDERIRDLAQAAESENWTYQHTESEYPYPILLNYVKYTYKRIAEESKIALSDDKQYSCFNTGLVTPSQEALYALFDKNINEGAQEWHFRAWHRSGHRDLSRFPALPDLAHYFDEPSDLVFDNRKELRLNVEHIVEDHKERFPAPYNSWDNYQLQTLLRGAIDNAKERVRRNYKTAIPQYYKGHIQLLLPLCFESSQRADLALAVAQYDKFYHVSTCLTLDMAYNNARQLARPDRDWLQP